MSKLKDDVKAEITGFTRAVKNPVSMGVLLEESDDCYGHRKELKVSFEYARKILIKDDKYYLKAKDEAVEVHIEDFFHYIYGDIETVINQMRIAIDYGNYDLYQRDELNQYICAIRNLIKP